MERRELPPVEKVEQLTGEARAEDGVVAAQERLDQRVDGLFRQQRAGHVGPGCCDAQPFQCRIQILAQLLPEDALVAVDDHDSVVSKFTGQPAIAKADLPAANREPWVEVVLADRYGFVVDRS